MPEHAINNLETAESSFFNLLSGWMQQGIDNFFAVQRVVVDLAVRQNAAAMQIVRERLADPAFCPMAIASEFVGEGSPTSLKGRSCCSISHIARTNSS